MAGNILKGTILVEAPNIEQTSRRVSSSVNTMAQSFNRAGTSLKKSKTDFTNLSRVIQDLPFGFIGISNNLTQLIPGVGALGLVFSGLVAAITFSSTGLRNWGVSSEEAKKKADDNARAQEEMKQAFDSAAASVVSQADKFKDLRNVLVDVSGQYTTLTDAVVKQGLAQFLFTSKEKVVQDQLAKTLEDRLKIERKLSEFRIESKPEDFIRQAPLNLVTDINAGVINIEDPTLTQFKKQQAERKKANDDTKRELNVINDIASRLGLNFSQFVDTAKSAKDPLDEIIQQAKQIASFFNEKTNRIFEFDVDPRDTKEQTAEKARDFIRRALDAAERGTFDFKLNTRLNLGEITVDTKLFDSIQKAAIQTRDEFEKAIERAVKGNPITLTIEIARREAAANASAFFGALGLPTLDKENPANTILKQFQKDIINTASLVDSTLTPAFEGFFDALLSGENPIEGFFNGIRNAIGSLIKEIGTALIKALLLKAIFSAFGFGGGGSVGDIFKGLLGFRAAGGPVSAGGSYIVGENGPELFTPNTGGRIVSNSDLTRGSIGGFSAQPVQVNVTGRISGYDLLLVQTLATKSQNRLS